MTSYIMKKLMGSCMPAGKEFGGEFLRGQLGEKCLVLNTDQVSSASPKNNCPCAKGKNVLQHKGKNELLW